MTTAAVLLAAGAGSRFTAPGHKLRASLDGRPVFARALAHALDAALDETIVVSGSEDIADLVPDHCTLVRNDDWIEGMASSLQVAVDVARHRGHDAIVVGLGDQPLLDPESWRLVAAVDAPIAVATYDGRRGHPVRISSELWSHLPTTGERGARVLFDSYPELVREVPCPGDPADIDTREDLDRWS